jgi:2-dehydro-3-deoxyphosphogluconate aldolase/(4S)-4-hydroxy-2-oxoglutarate aldolase
MDVERFRKKPLMGILRGVELDVIGLLVETIISAGLETIEITMNTRDASKLIREAETAAKHQLMIGAGTVLDMDSLKSSLDAGATFIVMPVFIPDLVAYCVKNKIPVFPGAFTPQEIYRAWRGGATMVKVFPVKFFGPDYLKEIKGPFNDIKLLACAGVTPQNMRSYFLNGSSAVAFGASVFRKEWLAKKDFASIRRSIEEYLHEIASIDIKSSN